MAICLQCVTCDCCGGPLGNALAFIVQAVLAIFWVAYASTVTSSVREINDNEVRPEWDTDEVRDARDLVVVLVWAEAAMLALLATITALTGCFCSDNEDRK